MADAPVGTVNGDALKNKLLDTSTDYAGPTTLPGDRQISPRHFSSLAPSSSANNAAATSAPPPQSSSHEQQRQPQSAEKRARSNGSPEGRPALERQNSNGKSSPTSYVTSLFYFHRQGWS